MTPDRYKPNVGELCVTVPYHANTYVVLYRTFDDAVHDYRVHSRPDPGELGLVLEHRTFGYSRVLLAGGLFWMHADELQTLKEGYDASA